MYVTTCYITSFTCMYCNFPPLAASLLSAQNNPKQPIISCSVQPERGKQLSQTFQGARCLLVRALGRIRAENLQRSQNAVSVHRGARACDCGCLKTHIHVKTEFKKTITWLPLPEMVAFYAQLDLNFKQHKALCLI